MKLEEIGFREIREDRIGRSGEGIRYCEWIITGRCNFSCPYCNRLKFKELDMGEIRKILDEIHPKYIQLTGGEPTCREDIEEIVREIVGRGIRCGMSTNGSWELGRYKKLVDMGLELYSISLDVDKSEMNKKYCGIGGMFEKVVENIKELSKVVEVTVGVVFNEGNIDRHGEIIKYISELGVRDIRIGISTKWVGGNSRFEGIGEEELRKHAILRYRVGNFREGREMRGSGLGKSRKCYLVKDDITIMGGKVYPCGVYAREGGGEMGDREEWFRGHDSYEDEICKKYCMDFKCEYNERSDRRL